jgi:hypothetical protein
LIVLLNPRNFCQISLYVNYVGQAAFSEEKRSMNNWQPCSVSGLASLSALKLAQLAPRLRKLAGRKSSSELSRHPHFTVWDNGETASLLAGEDFR